jgi:hypothetical protein
VKQVQERKIFIGMLREENVEISDMKLSKSLRYISKDMEKIKQGD